MHTGGDDSSLALLPVCFESVCCQCVSRVCAASVLQETEAQHNQGSVSSCLSAFLHRPRVAGTALCCLSASSGTALMAVPVPW